MSKIDWRKHLPKGDVYEDDALYIDDVVKALEKAEPAIIAEFVKGSLASKSDLMEIISCFVRKNDFAVDMSSAERSELADALVGRVAKPVGAEMCPCCGGTMVAIRGRYTGAELRNTCPTCSQEKLDQIRAISDKWYGVPCSNGKVD